MSELKEFLVENPEFVAFVKSLEREHSPLLVILSGAELNRRHNPRESQRLVDVRFQILKIVKSDIAEALDFIFKVVQRMARNVNSDNFPFARQFLHRTPLGTRRNLRLGNLDVAGFAKKTHLRRI